MKYKNIDEMKEEILRLKKLDNLRLKDWNDLSKRYSSLLKENCYLKKIEGINQKDIVFIKENIEVLIGCINILGDKIRNVRKSTEEIKEILNKKKIEEMKQ